MPDYKERLAIKSWAEDDRPREKFSSKGSLALSDAELLAILIGSGNRNESAVDLSKRILQSVQGNLNELARLNLQDLIKFNGIGEAKAISIATALELGKRRNLAEALERKSLKSSQAVYDILQPLIGDLAHEEFWVLYLNNFNKLIHSACISKGGITGTVVDIRQVYNIALQKKATSIILAHNHPSGNIKASQADLNLTRKIVEGGKLLDISVLDHVIVTEKFYYSFRDEGDI
ncbi:MAG: DNA repair protein RadC [Roseivirga sp.]|jgi:DNA repair protein RadC